MVRELDYVWSVVQVPALVRDIVLCSWARNFYCQTASHLTQVYKWGLVNLVLGVTLRWTSTPHHKYEIITCLMGHLAHLQTSFTFTFTL